MLVKCISDSIPSIQREYNVSDEDTKTTSFFTQTIGDIFNVYGLIIHQKHVDYLICEPESNPWFIASYFFEIIDPRFPPDWSLCLTTNNKKFHAFFERVNIISLLGYHELVTSANHYDGLLERERESLELFFSAKCKMDIWQKELTEKEQEIEYWQRLLSE